jgi:hypothetical protein
MYDQIQGQRNGWANAVSNYQSTIDQTTGARDQAEDYVAEYDLILADLEVV